MRPATGGGADPGGTLAGKYEILRRLDQTPFGGVYLVRHPDLDNRLVVRLLEPELASDPELAARFLQDARLSARLTRAGLVRVIDIGSDGISPLVVEEAVEATTIASRLGQHGALDVTVALEIAGQIATTLVRLHDDGVFHCNLEPRSVLLLDSPGGGSALCDLANARLGYEPARRLLCRRSAHFLPPEWLAPGADALRVDATVDVYGLGALIYTMCEGQPFRGVSSRTVDGSETTPHSGLALPAFTKPKPRGLVAVLARALTDDPRDRHQSMAELQRDLDACLASMGLDSDESGEITIVVPPADRQTVAPESSVAFADAETTVIVEPGPTQPASSRDFAEPTLTLGHEASPAAHQVVVQRPRSRAPLFGVAAATVVMGLSSVVWWAWHEERWFFTKTDPPEMRADMPTEAGRTPPPRVVDAAKGSSTPEAIAPTSPPSVPDRVEWALMAPESPSPRVPEGTTLRFRAEVARTTGEVAGVEWYLDDVRQAGGTSWEFRPEFAGETRTHVVSARALSSSAALARSWTVVVENVSRGPEIASATPAHTRMRLAPGAPQTFAVQAADPDGDGLAYHWTYAGRPVGNGAGNSVVLKDVDRGGTLEVRVSDRAGLAITQRWTIDVEAPNRPPTLAQPSPRADRPVVVEAGATVEFSARAVDADPDDAADLEWYLDGRKVASGRRWKLVAATGDGVRVEVRARDRDGATSPPIRWDVRVRQPEPSPPPASPLARVHPTTQRLAIPAGQPATFAVTPPSGFEGGPVTYVWSLDGKEIGISGDGRYRLAPIDRAGGHEVRVVARARSGSELGHQGWTLDVMRALESDRQPPVAVPAERASDASAGPVTAAEAEAWIAGARRAWERSDVDALRRLGIVTSDAHAAALRSELRGSHRLSSITGETLRFENGQAIVSFSRVDSDGRGGVKTQARSVFYLRRAPNGLVASSRRSAAE